MKSVNFDMYFYWGNKVILQIIRFLKMNDLQRKML
jgi:hypothetical protein